MSLWLLRNTSGYVDLIAFEYPTAALGREFIQLLNTGVLGLAEFNKFSFNASVLHAEHCLPSHS